MNSIIIFLASVVYSTSLPATKHVFWIQPGYPLNGIKNETDSYFRTECSITNNQCSCQAFVNKPPSGDGHLWDCINGGESYPGSNNDCRLVTYFPQGKCCVGRGCNTDPTKNPGN